VVGGQQRGCTGVLVAEKAPCGDGRQRVEEPEVVRLEVILLADAALEIRRVDERGIPERVVAGELPRQPELTRPEAGGPAAVAADPDRAGRRPQPVVSSG